MNKLPSKPDCEDIIGLFPDPFVIIDRHFQIVAANKKYSDHYHTSRSEIIGRHCFEVSHGIDKPCSQNGEHCPLEEVIRTGEATSVMHIHCNCDKEEHVQIFAAPIFDQNGQVIYMGETIQPINQEPETDQVLLGRSKAALRLMSILYRVAATSSTVLLLGESGVGKDCAARYIHQNSDRNLENFVVVDCGALGESLIESELFGYEKGAFTGAVKTKIGLIESADKGTLFIDEIGELPLHLQSKLLRVLETGTIRRLGGNEYIKVDVRIIAATNRDPKIMLQENSFRQDLYYRLCAFPISIPPLRDRKGDIPLLAESFIIQLDSRQQQTSLSPEVIEILLSHDYPGNIRELKNIIERSIILAAGSSISPQHILFEEQKSPAINLSDQGTPYKTNTRNHQITLPQVLEALAQSNGHRLKAAQILGVSERTIYRHLKTQS